MKPIAKTEKYFYPAYESRTRVNIFDRIMRFAEAQEENHFGWVGASIMIQASLLFPMAMLTVVATGGPFYLIAFAIAALAMVVVTNLAALPTKYTIPALIISAIMDFLIVAIALA